MTDKKPILPKSLQAIVSIDLETTLEGTIRHIGAVTENGQNHECKDCKSKALPNALQNLDAFCEKADFILGHNLIVHDLPVLKSIRPDLSLLQKPVIDTLFLSPLAFPKNPYHRLVKNYKLVRDAINNPVADAQLALSIFREQYQTFQEAAKSEPDLIRFYHFCFSDARVVSNESDCEGLTAVFRSLIDKPFEGEQEVLKALISLCKGLACPKQVNRIAVWHFSKTDIRVMLPYCIAWLKVSGGNSVLPPWVRHRFPEVPDLIKQLREERCGNDDCRFCTENHDPVRHLQRYFNYQDYRNTEDGRPLQREIVSQGMNDKPLLGILPTGGGKSICFQIPALVRYHRRGALTVVISPLQALMKDQIDNLKKKTGSMAVGAIYSMLTPPERGAVLEQVRLGDIGILYISPEQTRNKSVINALAQREIGCWVFDEAHCLSKWGHDFRPDYLYCSRFIREQSERYKRLPPVACYTATAKKDVIEDICKHFRDNLNQELTLFQGGVERSNLSYEVHEVTPAAKYGRVGELIEERLSNDGSCVIYCATRKGTEELAEYLSRKELRVAHFHAGLEAPRKKDILERFIRGDIPVICATNAFGMGVDKDNVRLVIHADIPGSLENYLQEAGRAGRDEEPAACILLFDEQDIETQFKFGALSEVRMKDIQQILRGLRALEKKPGQDIVITTGELLRSEATNTSFDLEDKNADTKVKTAVAWLERGGYMERNENANQVFQGKPLFSTLEEATQKLDTLQLQPAQRRQWELILSALINADPKEGMSADLLAEQIGCQIKNERRKIDTTMVMGILNQMGDVGLVSSGLLMTAFLRPKGKENARDIFFKLCQLERAMITVLQEEHPDDHENNPVPLDLRRLNQRLLDQNQDFSNPDLLRNLLKSLAEDGKGLAGAQGSIEFCYLFKDHYSLRLYRPWRTIVTIMKRRHTLAQHILETLYKEIGSEEQSSRGQVLVEFSLEKLRDSIKQDMTFEVQDGKILSGIERGLLFLHEQNSIILQQGLAVFRQAMTLKMNSQAKGRRYSKSDYDPLFRHYKVRVTQVHVMNEYVRLGLIKMSSALRLVRDYFEKDSITFLNRYFPGKKKLLELATSKQSLEKIVESLGNPQQQAIVQAPADKNMLVLAGPGAGKTRVVVHRCAYLSRVQRVRPHSILVLCYNHSAAVTLRKRLQQLLGRDAWEITVQTFHGLAMRLTGASLSHEKSGMTREFDFDELILKATQLLRGDLLLPGIAGDQTRERLLAGFQHILVDEYQDIDEQQYEMISAITGRTLADSDQKLSIIAVGDDDQSIYGFRDANIKFIKQFKEDYKAERHYLVQNYRSTGHIIETANSLIEHNHDRMKTEQKIVVNKSRRVDPAGGNLERLDPVGTGKVQILNCNDIRDQTLIVRQELKRLKVLLPELGWNDFAILARSGIQKPELSHMRSALEQGDEQIPVSLPLESGQSLPIFRIREFAITLEMLQQHREELATSRQVREWLDGLLLVDTNWRRKIYTVLDNWEAEVEDAELPVSAFGASLVDHLRESRRELRLGEGVHLGTVHGSKGMEFKVVILLDGGWKIDGRNDQEEERRLFYVGMTRAREQLVILHRQDQSNPHIPLLDEEACISRKTSPEGQYTLNQYHLLGLQYLYLSYAGKISPSDPIHESLNRTNTGDSVILKRQQDHIDLFSHQQPIARLSKNQAGNWSSLENGDQKARVIAMVHWRVDDSEEQFRAQHKSESWEVPVIEIVEKPSCP